MKNDTQSEHWYPQRIDGDDGEIYYEAYYAPTADKRNGDWAKFEGTNAKKHCDAFIALMNGQVARAQTPPVQTAMKRRQLSDVLLEHHKWHQEPGMVRLVANAETGLDEPIDIDMALEYQDSGLRERTEAALYDTVSATAPPASTVMGEALRDIISCKEINKILREDFPMFFENAKAALSTPPKGDSNVS